MDHVTALSPTGGRRNRPLLRSGSDQHHASCGTGLTHGEITQSDRRRSAGRLIAIEPIDSRIGWGGLDFDPIEPDLQLFGDQHGQGGIGSLSHLHFRHDDGDATGRVDPHISIQHRRTRPGTCPRRYRDTEHQPAPNSSGGKLHKAPSTYAQIYSRHDNHLLRAQ